MAEGTAETRFVRVDGHSVGFRYGGSGTANIVLVGNWLTNSEALELLEPLERYVAELESFARVVFLDQPGTGLSDPVPSERLGDRRLSVGAIEAAMDDVGWERAVVHGFDNSTFPALAFAADRPGRVTSLVLQNPAVRYTSAPDFTEGFPPESIPSLVDALMSLYGTPQFLPFISPSVAADRALCERWARWQRQSASPSTAWAIFEMVFSLDARGDLDRIGAPALVISTAWRGGVNHSRYVAERLEDARLVEFDIPDLTPVRVEDRMRVADEVEKFVTGKRRAREPDRLLSTVLFTDLVASTERAAAVGDAAWREVLREHDTALRRELDRHRGVLVKSTGDGVLATFDSPARAIRCALSMERAVETLGLQLRAAIHTGEIEMFDGDIGGIAVHIAARVLGLAGPGEVLVSGAVPPLVVGSGIEFSDRGEHELRGVPGHWRVLSVET